jgi:BMFP domain-containing protein YqiC
MNIQDIVAIQLRFESIEKRIGELEDKKQQGIDPFYFSNMVMRVGMDANEKMGKLQERIEKLEQPPKPSSPSKTEQTLQVTELSKLIQVIIRKNTGFNIQPELAEMANEIENIISNQDPSKVSISREVAKEFVTCYEDDRSFKGYALMRELKQSLQER